MIQLLTGNTQMNEKSNNNKISIKLIQAIDIINDWIFIWHI